MTAHRSQLPGSNRSATPRSRPRTVSPTRQRRRVRRTDLLPIAPSSLLAVMTSSSAFHFGSLCSETLTTTADTCLSGCSEHCAQPSAITISVETGLAMLQHDGVASLSQAGWAATLRCPTSPKLCQRTPMPSAPQPRTDPMVVRPRPFARGDTTLSRSRRLSGASPPRVRDLGGAQPCSKCRVAVASAFATVASRARLTLSCARNGKFLNLAHLGVGCIAGRKALACRVPERSPCR